MSLPPGSTNGNDRGSPRGNTEIGGTSISCSTASSHGTHMASPTTSSSDGREPLAGAGVLFERPVLDLQAPHPYVQPRRVARIDHGLGARR